MKWLTDSLLIDFSFVKKIGAKTLAAIAMAAVVLFGLTSLWAYWSTFGIYIFDFISFADILRFSLLHLAILSLVLVLPIVFVLLFSVIRVRRPDTERQEANGRLSVILSAIVFVVLSLIGAIAVGFFSIQSLCLFLFALAAIAGAIWDLVHVALNGWGQFYRRFVFCMLLGAIPLAAHRVGESIAVGLLENRFGSYVQAEIFDDSLLASKFKQYKLIGKLGDYYHFCSPDNSFVFSVHEGGIRFLQTFPIEKSSFEGVKEEPQKRDGQ